MSLSCLNSIKRTSGGSKQSAVPPLIAINALIFDVSGSTYSMGDAPAEQLHNLLITFQKDAIENNSRILISLHIFADNIRQVFPSNPDEFSVDMRTFDIPSIDIIKTLLEPRGCTALYDAGITGFDHINKIYTHELSKLPRNVRILDPYISRCYVLATDGLDNMSTHTISDFKSHTLQAKKNGIQPLFLFANIGTEMGHKMGFMRQNAAEFKPTYAGVSNMLRATTNVLRQVSSGHTQTIDTQSMTQDVDDIDGIIDYSLNTPLPILSSPPPLLRRA